MNHTIHPDSHAFGLADDCPRCAHSAAHPFESLDDDNLLMLIARVRDWDENLPRSGAEETAMRNVEAGLQHAARLASLTARANRFAWSPGDLQPAGEGDTP